MHTCENCGTAEGVRLFCRWPALLCEPCALKREAKSPADPVQATTPDCPTVTVIVEAGQPLRTENVTFDQAAMRMEPLAASEPEPAKLSKGQRRALRKAEARERFEAYRKAMPVYAGMIRKAAIDGGGISAGLQVRDLLVGYLRNWRESLTGAINPTGDYWELLRQIGCRLEDGSEELWRDAAKACFLMDRVTDDGRSDGVPSVALALIRCSRTVTTNHKRISRTVARRTNAAIKAWHREDPYDLPPKLRELWDEYNEQQAAAGIDAIATELAGDAEEWSEDDRIEPTTTDEVTA